MSQSKTIIGIDLGTTNSCVAIFSEGQARTIKNTDGALTTPSVVNCDPNTGELLVGIIAVNTENQFPNNTIRAVKRLMGKSYSQAMKEGLDKGLNYKIVASDPKAKDGGPVHVEIFGHPRPPEEISAAILKYLKDFVSETEDEEITEAVITVPAYFDETQRQATINAGKIAGLNVKKLINEPTAAALSYAADTGKKDTGNETIAVYDLGGGTFDITIAEIGTEKEAVENYADLHPLCHEGNNHLGGIDFDNVLVQLFKEKFKQENGVELEAALATSDDPSELARKEAELRNEAEKAKKALSRRTEYNVALNLCNYKNKIMGVNFKLTRKELEEKTIHLVEQTLVCCQKALTEARIDKSKIDHLFLVGGMVRMPLVQEKVENFFGKKPKKILDPDEVVAMGAAIAGTVIKDGILQVRGVKTVVELKDVISKSFGVRVDEAGNMSVLIEKGSAPPCDGCGTYSTVYDNQSTVEVEIFEGNEPKVADNSPLGSFKLEDIPLMPAGQPKIEVTFDLNTDQILTVSAKELSTGKSNHITVNLSQGKLSDEVIESLKTTLKVKD